MNILTVIILTITIPIWVPVLLILEYIMTGDVRTTIAIIIHIRDEISGIRIKLENKIRK